jgi:hypothetical protein
MNLPLTRARTPAVTGAVAALRSLTSTGQTPRCPRADRRLGSSRLPTRHVKPRETRCNPGSLSALEEPLSVVILSSTVTIGAPNFNDGHPSGVHGHASGRSRRSEGISLRHMLANRCSANACCAASLRQPSRLRTWRPCGFASPLRGGRPFCGRRVSYPKQQNCVIRLYRHRSYLTPVQQLTPRDTRCLEMLSVVKDGYIGHSAHLIEPLSKPREDPPQI